MSAQPVYPRTARTAQTRRPNRKRALEARRRRERDRALRLVAGHVLLFVVVSGLTLGFSSLLGHSLKEQARHEAVRSGERARSARLEVARLRRRVERLVTVKSIEDWSLVQGLASPYKFVANKPKPAVAQNLVQVRPNRPQVDVLVARMEGGQRDQ